MLYKLESEQATWVNLESETHVLHDHQKRLQRLAARVAADLAVITSVIVERQREGDILQQTVQEVPRETV